MAAAIEKYFFVAKPGIVFANLLTAAAGFLLASGGQVDGTVLLPAVVGIALVVASGCVFNNLIDRDIDRKMQRTRNRVLARGAMAPAVAAVYAALLGVAGIVLLGAQTNVLAAAVALGGFTVYVGLYSLYLKGRSVYAAIIGSLAGAAPPLAGYCAAGGRFDAGALLLLILFGLWQIPHFYAIAIFRLDDYAAAAIPALPIQRGIPAARRQIVGYIAAFTAAALLLTVGGYTGYRYFWGSAGAGLFWLSTAWSGGRGRDDRLWARRLFACSLLSILVVSILMALDCRAPVVAKMLLTMAP